MKFIFGIDFGNKKWALKLQNPFLEISNIL